MQKTITKKISLILIGIFFFVGFLFFGRNNFNFLKNYFKVEVASADDDEEDEADEEDDEEDGETFYETITETYSTKISEQITKSTVRTTFFDNDRDGIFDDEDKNPTINDFFIVEDDNLNGIVDEYEQ